METLNKELSVFYRKIKIQTSVDKNSDGIRI